MAMTPQQFGSLVGDQMGKDARAVAPKSLPVEALKMLGKAVYHTPRSLKTLAAGGAGGYALGHNAGEASGMKQAFLGAAGRAIGGAVSNAVSGAVNAAKPMVTNAINAVGNAAMKNPTAATVAAGTAGGAAMIPVAQHLENRRIDAQVDRQRARTMAQQPKPQMATGMPQAPAPAAAPQPAAPMMAKQAVPSGPGGGLYMGDPNQALAKPMAAANPPGYVGPTQGNPAGSNNLQNMPWKQTSNGLRRELSPEETTTFNAKYPPQPTMPMAGKQAVANMGQMLGDVKSLAGNTLTGAAAGQSPLSMVAGNMGAIKRLSNNASTAMTAMKQPLGADGMPRLGPGGAIRQQQVDAQQGQGLAPAQQKAMRTVAGVGQQMPKTPSNGVMPAGPDRGGIMGNGSDPLSMSMAGKQAGAINELRSEFGGRAAQGLKTQGLELLAKAQPMLDKARSGVQTYGKRMMGDSTLKPLQQRADLMNDMGKELLHNIPNPKNVAVNAMRYNPSAVGNPTQAVMNARRMRNTGNAAYKQLLHNQNDAMKAIAKERGAIDLTRNLTTGAGAAGTIGAVGMMARHNNKQANSPAPAASLAKSLAPYTSWGRGYNFGTDTTNQHHQTALAGGALMGGAAGLLTEAIRKKTEEEKNQSILRKFLRYAATSGAGAVGGAGAGGLVGALTAPGKLRMHDSVAAKLPADFTSGKLEAKGLMGLGPVADAK